MSDEMQTVGSRVVVDCSLPPDHARHVTVKPLTQRDLAARRRLERDAKRQRHTDAKREDALLADLEAVRDPAVRRLLGRLFRPDAPSSGERG